MFFPTYRAAAHRALRAITFNGLLKIQSRFLTYLDMLHCVCMCQLLRAQKQHTHTHRITQCAKVMTRHQITTRNNTFQRSHICDGTHTTASLSQSTLLLLLFLHRVVAIRWRGNISYMLANSYSIHRCKGSEKFGECGLWLLQIKLISSDSYNVHQGTIIIYNTSIAACTLNILRFNFRNNFSLIFLKNVLKIYWKRHVCICNVVQSMLSAN